MDSQQFDELLEYRNSKIPDGDWTSKPAIPASTVTATNTNKRPMFVEIAGGTVTVVKVDAVTVGARTSGMFYVRPGSTIAITYSVAPTWQWFPAL